MLRIEASRAQVGNVSDASSCKKRCRHIALPCCELACAHGHAEHTLLVCVENGLVVQRWQFQVLFQFELLGALLVADRARDATTPHFVILVLAMHREQLSVLLEVAHLLLDINGC